MKPCPSCHRVGTTHRVYSGTCYGCDPPDLDRYTLVEREHGGRKYLVEKGQLPNWESVIRSHAYDPKTDTFDRDYDTGMCGNQAIQRHTEKAADVFALTCRAIQAHDKKAIIEHQKTFENICRQIERDQAS